MHTTASVSSEFQIIINANYVQRCLASPNIHAQLSQAIIPLIHINYDWTASTIPFLYYIVFIGINTPLLQLSVINPVMKKCYLMLMYM